MTTTGTGNMHAFGADSKMKKYNTVLTILSEFFSERLRLYGDRKAHQMKVLQEMIDKLSAKIRFLTAVITGQVSFKGKRKQELVQELTIKGYPKQSDSYDYLLGMPLWNMTDDKIQALTSEHRKIGLEMSVLSNLTPRQLWTHDLDELMDAIHRVPDKKRKQSGSERPAKKARNANHF